MATSRLADYPRLAEFMTDHPESSIFRTFKTLTVKNLLYLQAEIAHIEQELDDHTKREESSPDSERRQFSKSWTKLSRGFPDFTEANKEASDRWSFTAKPGDPSYKHFSHWQRVLKTRDLVDSYHTALLQMREIQYLPEPNPRDLSSLRMLLQTPEYGDNFLAGSVEDVWEPDHHHHDYVQLGPGSDEKDALTQMVASVLLLMRRMSRSYTRLQLVHVPDRTIVKVANTISSVIASMAPVMALSSLYLVDDLKKRLGMILAFTTFFSFILLTTTRSRRIEIYAATAGFAAMQVIFVGAPKP